MHRNAIWIIFFGLILGGCASDRKIDTMESSGGNTSTPAVSSPTSRRQLPNRLPQARKCPVRQPPNRVP